MDAKWKPRKEFKPGPKDREGKLTYLGSMVWNSLSISIEDKPVLHIGEDEVLIEVKAAGICDTAVHLLQSDDEGYIFYPGLTAFPVTIGHEFAGTIAKAGPAAIDKRINKPFRAGDPVCAEEMYWCGYCRPCCDGYPNHCENLEEMGITVDGAFTEYMKVKTKYCWSLKPLEGTYYGDDLFVAGSLVEPTSIAYNAVIERGEGVRPVDSAVILRGEVIWNGKALNATVVIVAKADARIPLTGEVFQVRRANIVGSQGHSGHGTFPRVINLMAGGVDMTRISTKRIKLDHVPANVEDLQTNKEDCKVTSVS